MQSRSIQETKVITTAGAKGVTGQYSLRIAQQRRRLEMIVIEVIGNASALTTPTGDSLAAVLKRIRLKVNDGRSRSMIDVNGVSLLDFWAHIGGVRPAWNQASVGKTATGAFQIYYPIPIRCPILNDPTGVITGLPLYALGEDPILEVDTGDTEVAATFTLTGNLSVSAHLTYRNDTGPDYVPSELMTAADEASKAASSRLNFDLATGGALVGLQVQSFSNAALTTRATGLGSGGLYQLTYGRETVREGTDHQLEAFDGLATEGPLASASLGYSFLMNFLDDMPLGQAFSANSVLNLETVANGGDSAKLIVTNSAAGTPGYRLTSYKFLGGPIDKLRFA